MVKSMNYYTEEALENEADSSINHIVGYKREDRDCGVTKIQYHLVPGKHLHWLSLLTFGTATPIILVANGLQLLVLKPKTYYFDTRTEEYLGDSENEASRTANKRGITCCKRYEYKKANEWFNKAFITCTNHYSEEKIFLNNREATKLALEAHTLFNQGNLDNALKKFQEAYDFSSVQEIKNIFKESIDQVKASQELYKQGKELWYMAWKAENNQDDKAAGTFQEAKNNFDKLCTIVPGNLEYVKWSQICKLKIEGNELFNQGLELQEQGNTSKQKREYQNAIEKYQEALKMFQKGFEINHDQKFQACIELVKECINTVTPLIQNIKIEEQCKILESLTLSDDSTNHQLENQTNTQHELIGLNPIIGK